MANTVLDPEEKKQVQVDFQSWLEIQDRRKELTAESKAVVENASRILDCKPSVVTKLFRILKRNIEEGENELEELFDLVETVKN